jgi:hypothetical protein
MNSGSSAIATHARNRTVGWSAKPECRGSDESAANEPDVLSGVKLSLRAGEANEAISNQRRAHNWMEIALSLTLLAMTD